MNRSFLIFLLSSLILSGCRLSSDQQLTPIDKPDLELLKQFNIKPNGTILYQVYQEYGFNEQEKQLILIMSPSKKPKLPNKLPLKQKDFLPLTKINTLKYKSGGSIDYTSDIHAHADIRNKGVIYAGDSVLTVSTEQSFYKAYKKGQTQIIQLYDPVHLLLFIEAKK